MQDRGRRVLLQAVGRRAQKGRGQNIAGPDSRCDSEAGPEPNATGAAVPAACAGGGKWRTSAIETLGDRRLPVLLKQEIQDLFHELLLLLVLIERNLLTV